MDVPAPDRGGFRLRAVALALMAVVGVSCTGDEVEESASVVSNEDALDLGAAPESSAILAEDRGAPPSSLQVEDLVEGSGAVVGSSDELSVQFRGWRWSDGGEFASSWSAGQPFRFALDEGRVIAGWEQGILGTDQELEPLRVGGRRVLIVPPELAYGDRGAGSQIGPDETLVFVIDLVGLTEGVGEAARDRDDPDDPDGTNDASPADGAESEPSDG